MKKIQRGAPSVPPSPTRPLATNVVATPKPTARVAAAFAQTDRVDAVRASKREGQAPSIENPRLALLRPRRADPINAPQARWPIASSAVLRPREAIELTAVRPTVSMRSEPRAAISTAPRRGHTID